MLLPFDAAFKAEGDEQANGDGRQMQCEVPEAVHPFVGRVCVEHGSLPDCKQA
jgi:hypothetical protein